MESRIQRWSWVAHLAFIALAAALSASAVTRYVAIHLAPFTVPELPELDAPTDTSNVPKPRAKALAKSIVDRCWFGCPEEAPPSDECPDGCPDGQMCEAGACVDVPDSGPSEQLVASEITAKLLGVMVARDPQYSVALFADAGAKATFIVGVGDLLQGAEVIDITRDRVILQRNSKYEYIQLANTLGGTPTLAGVPGVATPTAAAPRGRGARGGANNSPQRGAAPSRANLGNPGNQNPAPTTAADGVVELSKASIDAGLSDEAALAGAARVVPNYVNGQSSGVKLVGVREDSVYKQLGIESGDVVTSINGTKVKNQAHAFELIQGLRGQSDASIGIERGNESKTLKYRVK